MKAFIAIAVISATAALAFAVGTSRPTPSEPLTPSVVRYVDMNVIFEKAEKFKEEREAMRARWESWNSELQELLKQGQQIEKQINAFVGSKKSAEYLDLVEEIEALSFRAGKKRERFSDQKNLEQIQALLKWSEDIEAVISVFAKKNGIDAVLQNWNAAAGEEEGLSLEERYRRILYRPAVYLDPSLDISLAIAAELK